VRHEVEALAAELGVSRLTFAGNLEAEALGALLAGASAVVVPSLWEEPAGLILLEAAAARAPVVASRVGGMPELLHDEEHALFFTAGDDAACAAHLARVLDDPADRDARVARAFARSAELDETRYLREVERFLSEVVEVGL
jgi:glycosyltransferase involved in cell wall biosynthesis